MRSVLLLSVCLLPFATPTYAASAAPIANSNYGEIAPINFPPTHPTTTTPSTPTSTPPQPPPGQKTDSSHRIIQIVFTSDIHFGITRQAFDGDSNVLSVNVNARLVSKINHLPALTLPRDDGVGDGREIGPIDYLMISGDIANRQETPIQSAAASWDQFTRDYLLGITLKDRSNHPTSFLLVPGNHDVSDAVGFYRRMSPPTDATSMAGIYNLMLRPSKPKTGATFHYPADKINYTRSIGGSKPKDDRIEQLGFVKFLKARPNIKAYFHGHNNWNEFYTYTGPDEDVSLPTFRVDSPMKGKTSSKDERRLSFQLISIDPANRTMTVRECLWNPDPSQPDATPVWGESRTIKL